MGVDPFVALGIEQPDVTMRPPGGGDAIPMMRVMPEKKGLDPFAALGIDPGAGSDIPQTSQPAKPQYGGFENSWRTNIGQGIRRGAVNTIGMLLDPLLGLAPSELSASAAAYGTKQPYQGPATRFLKSLGPSDVQPTERGAQLREAAAEGGANVVFGAPLMGGGNQGAQSVARSVSSMVPEAAIGAAGGVAGNVAEHAAPEPLKPLAGLVGNVAGMTAGGAGLAVGGKVFRAAGDYVGGMGGAVPRFLGGEGRTEVAGVKSSPTQQRAATGMVNEALGPEGMTKLAESGRIEARAKELESILANPASRANERITASNELEGIRNLREQIVPPINDAAGNVIPSGPTLGQVVPLPGVKTLEKVSATTHDADFAARYAAQNNANVAQIRGLAPETAEPGAVGRFFTQQLDALETEGQRAIEAQRVAGERNIATTEIAGQQAVAGARQGVAQATEGLGGTGTPDVHGEALRGHLETVNAAAKGREKALWEAVDPDGTLALPLGPVQETARGLIREMNPGLGDVVSGQEHQILAGAAALPEVVPFRDAQRLRSNIGFAERALRATPGNEQSLRRLGMLKSSLDDAIAQGAEAAAAADSSVATRLAAALRGENGPVPGGGSGAGVPTGGGAGVGTAGEVIGGRANAPGRQGGVAGNRGVAAEGAVGTAEPVTAPATAALQPNFDADVAGRYATARQVTLERKQTFGQGPVGATLRPGQQGADFRVEAPAVPRQFLTGNALEPSRVQAYVEAVGGMPQAVTAMRAALVNDLRNQRQPIIMDDGTVSTAGLQKWLRNHARTIEQFPGLREQLGTVERMQTAYDQATANAREATKAANEQAALELVAKTKGHAADVRDFERSAAGKLSDPRRDLNAGFDAIMRSDTRVQDFADLVKSARGKPEVIDGLRRLAADYIERNFGTTVLTGETEPLLRSGALRKWIEWRKEPLREIFGGQGLQNIEAVGAVLRRNQAAIARPAVAGPDTASKLGAMAKHGVGIGGHSLGPTAFALIGEHLMESMGHGTGLSNTILSAGGIAAGAGLHFLRQAGIRTRNELVKEMLLNPQLTREMQQKLSGSQLTPLTKQRIARAMLAGTATQRKDE